MYQDVLFNLVCSVVTRIEMKKGTFMYMWNILRVQIKQSHNNDSDNTIMHNKQCKV